MVTLIVKVVVGWLAMALVTLALILIFGQWYLDYICERANRSLDNWEDCIDFFWATIVVWPIMLISLPFRNVIDD